MNLQSLSFSLLLIVWSVRLFAAPVVTNINPVFGPSAGGNTVIVTGSGFTGATVVSFGLKNAVTFIVIDDNTIHAVVPINAPGAVEMQITAPSGTSALNPPFDYYTYQGVWYAYAPDFGSINVYPIDVATQALLIPITVGSEPNDVVVIPNGKIGIVTNSGDDTISIIDVATQMKIGPDIPIGVGFPIIGAIAPTPDGKRAAIVGYTSGTVIIVDLTTFVVSPPIPVGSSPSCIAILPNGLLAYVTNSGSGTLSQIDLQTLAVTDTISLGSSPSFISVTPDGKTAVITDDPSNSVFIFDLTTLTPIQQIFGFSLTGGGFLPGIAITPDGTTAWVTNSASNTIASVVGLNTPTPTFGSTIMVGSAPNGIAITPDGKQGYVGDGVSDQESIVTFSSSSVVTLSIGITPTDPGITPDQAPVAYFTPTLTPPGQASTFDATQSLSPVGTIVQYSWNFGDGHTATTSTPIITHTYAQAGTFTVTLTVTNSAGTSTTQTFTGQTVLNNGGPSAQLSQNITILAPSSANFNGYRCKDKFPDQTDYVNKLFWAESPNSTITYYQLFRNGILIKTISAFAKLRYNDPNRPKHQVDTYTLIGLNAQNGEVNSSTITVP
jgi:YVTN family beta-propeller protein